MGRSLDNTIRVATLEPTEWVLCEIHMHALAGGFAQGTAFLWSRAGTLLATASQSIAAKLWDPAPTEAVSGSGVDWYPFGAIAQSVRARH